MKDDWADRLEGEEVTWGGWRWVFENGVPRTAGPARVNERPREPWLSLADACRVFDVRDRTLRYAIARGRVRAKHFKGNAGPGSPTIFVAVADVEALGSLGKRGPRRRKSIRDLPTVGAVVFINDEPVPLKGRSR